MNFLLNEILVPTLSIYLGEVENLICKQLELFKVTRVTPILISILMHTIFNIHIIFLTLFPI